MIKDGVLFESGYSGPMTGFTGLDKGPLPDLNSSCFLFSGLPDISALGCFEIIVSGYYGSNESNGQSFECVFKCSIN